MKISMKMVSAFILIAVLLFSLVVPALAAPTQAELDETARQEAIKYYETKDFSPGAIRNVVFNPADEAQLAPRDGEYEREKNIPAKAFDALGAAPGGKGNMPLAKYEQKLLYDALRPYHYASYTNNGDRQIGGNGKGGNGYLFADNGNYMTFKLPVDARSQVTMAQLIVTVNSGYYVAIAPGITNPNLSTRPGTYATKGTPNIFGAANGPYYREVVPPSVGSGTATDEIFDLMPLINEIRTAGKEVGAVYVRIGDSTPDNGWGGQVRRIAVNYNKDYSEIAPTPPGLIENTGPDTIKNYSFFMEGNPEKQFLFAPGGQGKEGVRERFCDGGDTAVYRFPYDPSRKAWLQIQVMANYFVDTLIGDYSVDDLPRVQAYSTKVPEWYPAADAVKDDIKNGGTGKGFGSEADGVPGNIRLITIEITEEMHLDKTMDQKYVYLRFGDMSTSNGNGGCVSWIGYTVDELGALNPGATLDQEKQIFNLSAYNTRNPYDTKQAANPGAMTPFPGIELPPLPSADKTEQNKYYASQNALKKQIDEQQASNAVMMSELAVEQSDIIKATEESRDAAWAESEQAITDTREASKNALEEAGYEVNERIVVRNGQPHIQTTAVLLPNYTLWFTLLGVAAAILLAGALVQFLLAQKKLKSAQLSEAAGE